MSVIQRIKELREKATHGEWDNVWGVSEDDETYILALHNAFPQLIQEHEALLRFVERVKGMDTNGVVVKRLDFGGSITERQAIHLEIEAALQALDKELKG